MNTPERIDKRTPKKAAGKSRQWDEVDNGWTFDVFVGAACQFEHVPYSTAEKRRAEREQIFVVETINWSYANGDRKAVHHNRFYAFSISSAVAIAASIEIAAKDVCEEVVAIRPATKRELALFLKVSAHYDKRRPSAISDQVARSL